MCKPHQGQEHRLNSGSECGDGSVREFLDSPVTDLNSLSTEASPASRLFASRVEYFVNITGREMEDMKSRVSSSCHPH